MQWTGKCALSRTHTYARMPKLLGDREGTRLAFCAFCLPLWNSTRHDGAALLHCTLDILWRCHYCCGPAAFPVSSREWQLLMERMARYIVRFFFLTASRLVSRGGGGAHERRRWSFFFFFLVSFTYQRNGKSCRTKPLGSMTHLQSTVDIGLEGPHMRTGFVGMIVVRYEDSEPVCPTPIGLSHQ